MLFHLKITNFECSIIQVLLHAIWVQIDSHKLFGLSAFIVPLTWSVVDWTLKRKVQYGNDYENRGIECSYESKPPHGYWMRVAMPMNFADHTMTMEKAFVDPHYLAKVNNKVLNSLLFMECWINTLNIHYLIKLGSVVSGEEILIF